MNAIDFIVTLYELSWYHIIIVTMGYLIVHMNYNQRNLFRKLVFLYPVVVMIIYLSGIFELRHLWLYEQLFYSLSVLLIYSMGDNEFYFLLGLASMMFISEFYEIPIYMLRYNRMNWFKLDDISTVFSLGVIISKLFTGYYILYIMNYLGFKYRDFLSVVIIYICLYIYMSYFYLNHLYLVARSVYFNSGIVLKCLCFITMLIFIYVSDANKHGVTKQWES